MDDKDKLSRAVIKAKHGAEGLDWIPSKHNGSYGVGFWKFVMRGLNHVFSHIVFEVGDGSIFFWHSKRCDGVCLRDRFPFYLCSYNLIMWSTLLPVVWLLNFVRLAFSEDDSVNHVFTMLDMTSSRAFWTWSDGGTSTGKFTVKS